MTKYWKVCRPDPIFRSLSDGKVISIEFGSKCYFFTIEEAQALIDDLEKEIEKRMREVEKGLAPCPVCGSQPVVVKKVIQNDPVNGDTETYQVRCPVCRRCTSDYTNPGIAIMHWNGKEGE